MKKRSEAAPINESVLEEENRRSEGSSGRSLTVYAVLLVLVVVLCIVLSYLIQNRNNREIDTLNQQNITAQQRIENLQDTNLALSDENAALKTENGELQDQITALEASMTELQTRHDEELAEAKETYEDRYRELLVRYQELITAANAAQNEPAEEAAATETTEDGGTDHA